MQEVGKFSGSLLNVALTSRSILAVAVELTTAFPWKFGHVTATLKGHTLGLDSLVLLEGGRPASSSEEVDETSGYVQ